MLDACLWLDGRRRVMEAIKSRAVEAVSGDSARHSSSHLGLLEAAIVPHIVGRLLLKLQQCSPEAGQ